jgi:inositol transport system substrate-binding protein
MKKTSALFFVFLLIIGIFSGCQKSGRVGKVTQIGFVTCNLNDSFQVDVMNAFKDYFADKPEYELIIQDSQEDVVRQQDMVNALLSQGVKAITVVPVNTDGMDPIIASVQAAGIPLVFVNRNPFGESTPPKNMYYIGSQEIVAGQYQGEELGKLLNGKGNVCILMGIMANEGTIKRTEGNEQIFREKYPDIKVLAKEPGNWQRDQGLTITENWLTAYGNDINAILGNNDGMALGAVEALKNAGRNDVIVMGIDAIPDAKVAVRDGSMAATVLQDAVGQGRGAAETTVKVLNGETPDAFLWIPFVLINKDNLSQFE